MHWANASLFFAFFRFFAFSLSLSLFIFIYARTLRTYTNISNHCVSLYLFTFSALFFLTRHELAYATANFILKSIEEREKKTKWIKSRKHGDFMILISCYSPSYALFACAGLLCTHAILLWVPLNIKLLQWKLRFSVYFFHYSSSAM